MWKAVAKVKRATKISSFCHLTVLDENQKSCAKVKRADQKWKEQPKKQNLPKLHFGQKSKELTKSEKSSPKVKRAEQKWKAPQNNANSAFALEKQNQILLKRAKQKAKFGFA